MISQNICSLRKRLRLSGRASDCGIDWGGLALRSIPHGTLDPSLLQIELLRGFTKFIWDSLLGRLVTILGETIRVFLVFFLFSFFSASEISVSPDPEETEHRRGRHHSVNSFIEDTNPEEPLLSSNNQVTSYNSFKNSVSMPV